MESEIKRYNNEVRQFFWRNYLAHSIEGGFFMGGLAFVAAATVMPAMISLLGGPDWLVSLMPVMMMLGFSWPPLLFAHRVEQLYWMKPFLMITSVLQRLPYLLAGIFLFWFADSHPQFALICAASAPFISGSIGGISVCAWQELTVRVIPVNRRASGMAIRKIIASMTGLLAGGIIKTVLDEHPGAEGLGILHFYAFACLAISFFIFATIRETKPLPPHPDKPTRSFAENMRSLPGLIRNNPCYRRFILVKLLGLSIFIPAPFLAIHALETTGSEPGLLGTLVVAQMIGTMTGNTLAGWIGDRKGARSLLITSRLLLILLCVGTLFVTQSFGFIAVFFLFGLGLGFGEVGENTLALEIVPEGRRPTCLALLYAVAFVGMLSTAAVSTLLKKTTGIIQPSLILAAVCLTTGLLTVLRIKEPRRHSQT
jgi:MFS family permease